MQRLTTLAFSDFSANVREMISLEYFVDGLKNEEIQMAVRIADFKDPKSALLYALKVEAANEASCRDRHSIRGARVTADAPCESPCIKEIETLREEIQDLTAKHQNLRKRRITCWGCGGAGHLRSSCPRINKEDRNIKCWGCGRTRHVKSNCPRVNQEDPCSTSVIESKKVCSHRKRSADTNGDVRSRKNCPENSKYCSRVGKKFGGIDPIVRQVTTPSTSALDPWTDKSVRKDQLADPEIKPIIEFKESSDEKPSWQDITPFHPITKRY
ncbi:gag-pol [Trichonephila clavipes]|nr:gag-pol [Trichonephila clavipes]